MIALALGIFALAIPAAASASPVGGTGESSVNVTTGQSDEASQQSTGADYSSVNSITAGQNESSSTGGPQAVDSGYASPTAIAGPLPDRFTVASPAGGSPASSGEGFDWPSAAVGAGAMLTLAAFGGVALLTVRRRTATSPSVSTS